MPKFWLLLLAFLTLAVGADDDAGGDDDSAPGDDGGTGDPTLDDLIEFAEGDDPAPPKTGDDDEPAAVKEANRRARLATEDADRERNARIAAEDRARASAPRGTDPVTEAEDRQLADLKAGGADENTLYWARFQIEQKREMRATRAESRQALSAAQDISDKTAFDQLAITKPAIHKKYADKVEKAVAELTQSTGNRPSRLLVLRMMLGDDLMKGNLKPKKAAPKPQDPERTRTVQTRSDVRGNGKGNSEREKRIARLENQRI